MTRKKGLLGTYNSKTKVKTCWFYRGTAPSDTGMNMQDSWYVSNGDLPSTKGINYGILEKA